MSHHSVLVQHLVEDLGGHSQGVKPAEVVEALEDILDQLLEVLLAGYRLPLHQLQVGERGQVDADSGLHQIEAVVDVGAGFVGQKGGNW